MINSAISDAQNARIYNLYFGKSPTRIAMTQQPAFNFGQHGYTHIHALYSLHGFTQYSCWALAEAPTISGATSRLTKLRINGGDT